jgi:hypothetical protein
MATKIKRCLYVGLGGTGMNALLHTKKTFMDTYGEVPPMIGFLGIDTDSGAYKKSLLTVRGEEVTLSPNEQLPILVKDARPIYDVNKEDFSWIPEKNLYALTGMTLGAGQVRTNGRFAFTVNYVHVAQKVHSILDQITNAHIQANDKYELLSTNTEIHMVFSVCGGTGCGTFINMAYLLRKEAPNCKLTGYAVLPDIFKSMSRAGMAKVAPNAYGAIVDLDYLMHMGIGSTPLKLDYIKDSYEIRERPFNSVVFIDNKNENLDTYTHVDELTEMISLALVTSAGELSSASASVSDNLEKNITEGTMDIENKKAWAAGMGICEIFYRNEEISNIYAIKAAKILIDRLFNSCEDADIIVNAWIDSPEVNIRENNNNDHVIDFIADKAPKYDLSINEDANAMPEVEQYLQMNKIKDEEVNAKVTALTNRVRTELRKLLITHINKECGISTTRNIIESIDAQIDIYLGEMKKEKEDLTEMQPRLRSTLDATISDLKEYDGKFWKTKGTLEEKEEDVIEAAKDLCINMREITRRDAAIKVFNDIKSTLIIAAGKVNMIAESLLACSKKLTSDLARLQNNVSKAAQTFQIDLAQDIATSLTIHPEEIVFADFVRMLKGTDKIYGFVDLGADEIEKFILKYTKSLHTTKELRNTTIDDIVNKMEPDEFERMIKLAINKSLPMFRYSYRGHHPKENPRDGYYVGLPDKAHSRLVENDYFKKRIQNADCDFASIGVTDKIIIYRQIGVVPAYTINEVEEYRKEFEDCNADCHIDYNWEVRMQREEFSLNPKRATDDDLLDLWVKGFVFGLVKNENGEYMFQSQEHGDALDDNWVSIGKYRDEAFENFRRYKTSIRKEFTEFLENLAASKGADAMRAILAEVHAAYLDKFSQINMTKEEIKKHGFEKIRLLITDEINHAKNL